MPDLPPVVCVVPLLSKKRQSGIIVPVKNRSGPAAEHTGLRPEKTVNDSCQRTNKKEKEKEYGNPYG